MMMKRTNVANMKNKNRLFISSEYIALVNSRPRKKIASKEHNKR